MTNHRTLTDGDGDLHCTLSALDNSGLQDASHPSLAFSSSSSLTDGDPLWFSNSQMIVTSSSFYDPAQAQVQRQQPINVWDAQFAPSALQRTDFFAQSYHNPYTNPSHYSFPQHSHAHENPPQHRPIIPAPRRSSRAPPTASPYYRHTTAQAQPQIPSRQQQSTSHTLPPQRPPQLIVQPQFSQPQSEHQFTHQSQSQSQFSPSPTLSHTQSQFHVQHNQFSPTRTHPSQFSHAPPPHHAHAHVQTHPQTHAHARVQAHPSHAPQALSPTPSSHAHHYSPSDAYYISNDVQSMYHTMNAPAPSLTSAPAHAHSMSPHSPFATFGAHTPPTSTHTPSSDGGMLGHGLPHSHSHSHSHESISPSSYASHPMTTSPFEEVTSGPPVSSALNLAHISTGSGTGVPGSPPIMVGAPAPAPLPRVQIRQRPIMPTSPSTTIPSTGTTTTALTGILTSATATTTTSGIGMTATSPTTAIQTARPAPPIVPKPAANAKRTRAPKRPRPSTSQGRGGGGDSDDESDEDEVVELDWTGPSAAMAVGVSGGVGAGAGTGNPGQRKSGACSHCKRLKMKCDFPEGASTCKRCATGGHPCIVEGRKPRTVPNKREYLLAQIRHKDQIIESLLKQLHNPYLATPLSIASYRAATSPSDSDNLNVVDWLDRLQASIRQPGMPAPTDHNFLRNLRNPSGAAMDDSEEEDPDADVEGPAAEEQDVEKVRDTLPDAAVPIGLLANLSLDKDKDKGKGRGRQGGNSGAGGNNAKPEDDDDNVGVANKEYFLPGPASNLNIRKTLVEQHTPEIVLHGLVNNADVDRLFDIFWKQINPFMGLLDPTLHTSQTIFQRCPFLFTVVCAISSRYYKEKSEIYPVAMHFAKHSAANALIDGWKSVELCQAYILMSVYAVPARRWEEDRSWLYTGLAARIATDLNLHQVSTTQPQTERQEREMLNRARVWMICFNIDRSTATQFGKPSTIKEDYITRHSADWYKQSRYRSKFDIHLCAYSTLLRILGRFHDDIFSDPNSPTGLNKGINFLQVTLEHDRHLSDYFEEWSRRFREESDPGDPGSLFRCTLLPFLVSYSRLVMYSFGFQHAFQRGMEASDNVFLDKCFESAKVVTKQMIEVLAPSGLMRSAPDGHFVFASFASAFMLKLLRPEFAQLLTRQMEDEIFELIGRLITTLQDVAIDERHTPRLYARFLASLLTRHRKGGGGVSGRGQQVLPPQSQVSRQSQSRNNNNSGNGNGNNGNGNKFSTRSSLPSNASGSAVSGPGYSGVPHSASVSVSASGGTSQRRRDDESMQMTLERGIGISSGSSPLSSTSSSSSEVHHVPTRRPSCATAMQQHSEVTYDHAAITGDGGDGGDGGGGDMDVGMADVLSESGTLAAMHALNDAWWSNMMMPGFSWPEGPHLNGIGGGGGVGGGGEVYGHGIPGIHPSFGGYAAEPQLAA